VRAARRLIAAGLLVGTLGACGSGSPSGASPRATTSSAGGGAVARARQQLCEDLLLIQSGFRPDAFGRLLPRLRADVSAFAAAGDTKDARTVHQLARAMARLRKALLAGRGVGAARNAVEAVVGHLPGC